MLKQVSLLLFVLSFIAYCQSQVNSPNSLIYPQSRVKPEISDYENHNIKSLTSSTFYYENDSLIEERLISFTKFNRDGDTIKNITHSRWKPTIKTIIRHRKKTKTYLIYKDDQFVSKRKYDKNDSLIYRFSPTTKRKSFFIRDSADRVVDITTKRNHRRKSGDHFYHTYNPHGLLTSKIRVSDKDTTFKEFLKYNKQNQIVSVNKPMPSYNIGPMTTLFFYDERGNLTRKLLINHETKDTVEIVKKSYTYGKSFYEVTVERRRWNDHKLIVSVYFKYDYDDNLLKECKRGICNEKEFSPKGYLLSYKTYREASSKVSYHYLFKYDKKNRLIKKIDATDKNTYSLLEYDESNKLIHEKIYKKGILDKEVYYNYTDRLLTEKRTHFYDKEISRKSIFKFDYVFYR